MKDVPLLRLVNHVTYGRCYIHSNVGMRCPMCGVEIPPNVEHECARGGPSK